MLNANTCPGCYNEITEKHRPKVKHGFHGDCWNVRAVENGLSARQKATKKQQESRLLARAAASKQRYIKVIRALIKAGHLTEEEKQCLRKDLGL